MVIRGPLKSSIDLFDWYKHLQISHFLLKILSCYLHASTFGLSPCLGARVYLLEFHEIRSICSFIVVADVVLWRNKKILILKY